MPWDYHTPLGYSGEVIYGVLLSEAYLIGNGSILMLFVCMCLHHKAFYRIFRDYTRKLDHICGELQAKNHFHETIQFYVSVKT